MSIDDGDDQKMDVDLDQQSRENSPVPSTFNAKRGRRKRRRRAHGVKPNDLMGNMEALIGKDIQFMNGADLQPPRKPVKMLRKWIQTIDIYLGTTLIWRLHSRNRLFKHLTYPRRWAYEDGRKTKSFNWTGVLVIPDGALRKDALLHFLTWLRLFTMWTPPAAGKPTQPTSPPTPLDDLPGSELVPETLADLLALHAARQLLDPVQGRVCDAADVVRDAIVAFPHSYQDLNAVWDAFWVREHERADVLPRRDADPAFVFPDRGVCVRAAQAVATRIVDGCVDIYGRLDRDDMLFEMRQWSRAFKRLHGGDVARVLEEGVAFRERAISAAFGSRFAAAGGRRVAFSLMEEIDRANREVLERQERRLAAMGPPVVLEL